MLKTLHPFSLIVNLSNEKGSPSAFLPEKLCYSWDFQPSLGLKTENSPKNQAQFESVFKWAIFKLGSASTFARFSTSISSPVTMPCGKYLGSGNRCGHNPKNPNFFSPNIKIPEFLQFTVKLFNTSYTDLKLLVNLNYRAHGFQIRSERREACIKVFTVMLERMDLVTMRVGFPTENGFLNYSIKYLTERTGMGERRVARAIRDLKNIGFLIISQIRERLSDGSYRSRSAIKKISSSFFDALNLRGRLEKERLKARERLNKKQKAYEKEFIKKGTSMIRQLTSQLDGLSKKTYDKQSEQTKNQTESKYFGKRSNDPVNSLLNRLNPEAKAAISKLAVDLYMTNPKWNREKVYKEAKKLLPSVYRSPDLLQT